jgi:hypothetical protein
LLIEFLKISQLLTAMVDNIYEAHLQIVNAVAERAMENMKARSGSHLQVADFAFGFGGFSNVFSVGNVWVSDSHPLKQIFK